MNYNYNEIKNKVENIVKEACYSEKNKFTHTAWPFHIVPVVEHSMNLGKKLGADLEVLELAAYLHDYSGILDFSLYSDHHLHSAKLAEDILSKFGYPKNKIEEIKHCIVSHRGSVEIKRETIEAKILASADAMSHITELADMFYLTFGVHKYRTGEGVEWLKNKLDKSWNKIMPEGKDIVKDYYDNALEVLNKALKRIN